MASTIKNFLIGIGYEYDDKGEKQIESGIDSIKSKALQLGAVVAGAFGIKALTSDFAAAKDELGKFAQVFGVSANDVNAFGQVLEHEGGTLDSFMGQLAGIAKLRAGLEKGDTAIFGAAGLAGISADATKKILEAEDSVESLILLADEMQGMTQEQKLNAAAAFGIDESMIRVLEQGSDKVRELLKEQKLIRPVTESMTKAAKDFNDETQTLSDNVGGFSDRISDKLVPEINNVLSGMNQWIAVNRDTINTGLDTTLETIADNFGLVAGALGIVASSAAFGMLVKFGRFIPLFGSLATSVGLVGSALVPIAGIALGAVAAVKFLNEALEGTEAQMDIGRGIAKVAAFFGNDEAQAALDAEDKAEQDKKAREKGNVLRLAPNVQASPGSDTPVVIPKAGAPTAGTPEASMMDNVVPMPTRELQKEEFKSTSIESNSNQAVEQRVKVDVELNSDLFEAAVTTSLNKEVNRTIEDTKSKVAG